MSGGDSKNTTKMSTWTLNNKKNLNKRKDEAENKARTKNPLPGLEQRAAKVMSKVLCIGLVCLIRWLVNAVSSSLEIPKVQTQYLPQNFDNGNNGSPLRNRIMRTRRKSFAPDRCGTLETLFRMMRKLSCYLFSAEKLNVTLSFLCASRNNREESWRKVIMCSYIVCYFNTLF